MFLARLTLSAIVACLLANASVAVASIEGTADLKFLKVGPANGSGALPLRYNSTSNVTANIGQLIWDVTDHSGTPLPLGNFGDNDAANDNLMSFCIEISQYVSGVSHTYTKTTVDQVWDSTRAGLLDLLADNRWAVATVGDLTNAMAFQLAVWEILYDTNDLNVSQGSGSFYVNSTTTALGAIELANEWLGLLTTTFQHDDNVSVFALTNPSKQDQLVQYATPVQQNQTGHLPEPLSLMVWVGLLGACGAVGRRASR